MVCAGWAVVRERKVCPTHKILHSAHCIRGARSDGACGRTDIVTSRRGVHGGTYRGWMVGRPSGNDAVLFVLRVRSKHGVWGCGCLSFPAELTSESHRSDWSRYHGPCHNARSAGPRYCFQAAWPFLGILSLTNPLHKHLLPCHRRRTACWGRDGGRDDGRCYRGDWCKLRFVRGYCGERCHRCWCDLGGTLV